MSLEQFFKEHKILRITTIVIIILAMLANIIFNWEAFSLLSYKVTVVTIGFILFLLVDKLFLTKFDTYEEIFVKQNIAYAIFLLAIAYIVASVLTS